MRFSSPTQCHVVSFAHKQNDRSYIIKLKGTGLKTKSSKFNFAIRLRDIITLMKKNSFFTTIISISIDAITGQRAEQNWG